MRKVLAKIVFTGILALSLNGVSANRFDQMETYREIQRLMKVEGSKKGALELAKNLVSQLDQSDDLYKDVRSLIVYLGDGNPSFPLEKAVKFATGKKDEIYCKGTGLVYLKAQHNDGTESEVKLISSNRDMGGTYNLVKSGDWIYELDTAYRLPMKSESWMEEATTNSFRFKEVRNRSETEVDRGQWSTHWQGDSVSSNFHTSGDTPEPMPMQMANDYHLWGNYDLGFKLEFRVGFKDQTRSRETGSEKMIILKTQREVTGQLAQFDFKDAAGTEHSFKDCFRVHSQIELDRLEDYKERKSQPKKETNKASQDPSKGSVRLEKLNSMRFQTATK